MKTLLKQLQTLKNVDDEKSVNVFQKASQCGKIPESAAKHLVQESGRK